MTLQEIKERIAVYESKWGKLGHTNIMKPENELQHSELNERRNTMIKTTNDFYKFRQKVAIGKEANKLAHKATISPEELNERNFQNQIDNNTLIHAAKKGEKFENAKYYAREGEPGNYRYYYSKEEYDAAHNQKKNESAMEKVQRMHNEKESNVKGMIKDGIVYEKGEDGKFHKTDKKWDDVRKQAIEEADNKIIDAAKEGGYEAAKKAIFDDERMDEMFTQFEGGFENHGWELNDDGSITGMNDDDEKYFKKMETWLRSFKDSTGIDIYKNPDFQKSVMDEIRNRYNLMKNQAKEREDIKNSNKKYAASAGADKKSVSEETKETAKKAGENAGKAAKSGVAKSEFNKGLNDTITNEGADATADYIINNSPEWKEMVKAYRQAVNDGYIKMYRDGGRTVKNKEKKELRDKFDPIIKNFESVLDQAAKNPDYDRDGVEKLLENELNNVIMAATEDKYGVRDNTKKLEHSAFDEEDETPSYKTAADLRQEREESIMSEYRAFKARANKGAEKNRLSHSAVISPRELNARYEEELAKEYIAIHPENDEFESLSHSGQNFKYYAKVDLGNGNSRYFYTKEEYDAYNNPKKTASVGPVKKETIVLADPNEKSITKKTEEFVNTDAIKRYAQDRKTDEDKAHAKQNIKNLTGKIIEKGVKETYKKFEDSLKEEVKKRMKKIEKIDSEYGQDHGPSWNPYKDHFKDPEDIYEEWYKEWAQKARDAKTPEEIGKINKAFEEDSKNIKAKINEELDKQEESAKTWIKVRKAAEKVGSIDNDLKKLDAYDAYSILEEMGLDSIDDLYDDDILKEKFGINERIFDDMYIRGIDTDGDYGISRMNEMIDNYNNLWNAYKNAKKSLGHSSFDDEDDKDSLSHNSNCYGGTYLHKLDDFYGPGKPRYFYSEADWNAYQEGLKRNNYIADKEAEAKQAKTDKQKADLARRSGMENYTKYQENKKADEEADARQAKIDEQKTRAKQKAGMEGYEEWNEKRQAEKEANAKKVAEDRNDMGGYAAWKKRRDYINNQKKASEAADAAEAEKHEIEKKAVKNSVEVTKNKAAAKAQEAAEAEKHEAESDKRIAEERAANAKKDAASKEAAMKAGQKSTMKEAENAALDKEHKADKEKAKWNNLNNNVTSILEKASKKYDNQLEALNKEYDSIKDKSSPEAKAVKDKISQTNTKKDAELDKEIMTVVKDLGEIFNDLEDKNGPEAKLLKAQARRALDYSSNTKLAKVMGETNSWINAGMKHPKEV